MARQSGQSKAQMKDHAVRSRKAGIKATSKQKTGMAKAKTSVKGTSKVNRAKSRTGVDRTSATVTGNAMRVDSPASSLQTPQLPMPGRASDQPTWVKLTDEKLLDVRICDLDLDFEQTSMVAYRQQLYAELKQKNIRLRPHCWFSDDWFSPDGIPGIAVPFYMAHRRLMRLERNQMLEVEGGTKEWCMRIMRHEAGHAIDTAFRLHRRKGYRDVFGNYSDPYPESYRPRPRSKEFVLHLEPWYAQSHPAEDFAETFAVWLRPGARWRKDYEGWPAIDKVEFVDQMLGSVAGKPAKVTSRAKVDPAHRITKTLREHYQERQARYSFDMPSVFDDDLKKLFCGAPEKGRLKTAAAWLSKNQREFCATIAQWTGEYRYNVNQVIREMIERCRMLKLYVDTDEVKLKQDLLIVITMHTMNYLHAGHRVAL